MEIALQTEEDPSGRRLAAEAAQSRLLAVWVEAEGVSLWWGHGGGVLRSSDALRAALGGDGAKVFWGATAVLARLRRALVGVSGRIEDLQLLSEILEWRYGPPVKPCDAQTAWTRWRGYFGSMALRPTERHLYLDLAELRARLRPELEAGAEIPVNHLESRLLSQATGCNLTLEPPHLIRAAAYDLGAHWLAQEIRRQQGGSRPDRDACLALLDGIFSRHPELREWAERTRAQANRSGYVETHSGRRIRIARGRRRPQWFLMRAEKRDRLGLLALRLARRLETEGLGWVRQVTGSRISVACQVEDVTLVERLGCELDQEAVTWN